MEKEKKVYEPEETYATDFQVALTISLVIFIVLFLTVKTVEVKAYRPASKIETIVEELPPELQNIEEPPPPPKPKLPVEIQESEEAEEEEQEIEFTPTTEFNELETPPPPKVEEKVYEFYNVEIKPQVIKRVEPEYPELARKAGIEGRVIVMAIVDTAGNVVDVQVLQSTNPIFNEPALAAARQFKFKPGYQRDKPVKVRVAIPFHFYLER